MTTALETVTGLTVEHKTLTANGAAVLQVRHDVPIDSLLILKEGESVSYTDFELGLQFKGKITTVRPNFATGEGLQYICADAYRTLAKTPGFITGDNGKKSAKVKFLEGTLMKSALNALLIELPISIIFPGGVDLTDLPNPVIPTTDKGGQFLDTWIDDLLENTEGGIAQVELDSNGDPVLKFRDFYAQPDITLEIGNFNTLSPVGGGDPVLEQANAGKTLDRKFKRIVIEGCGEFTRREDVFIAGVGTPLGDPDDTTRWKFTFPEKRVTGRFLDPDGKCFDIFIMKFQQGFSTGLEFSNFFINPAIFLFEELDGQMFALVDTRMVGSSNVTVVTTQAWFTYTSYDGPIIADKISADAALDNEGDYWEDMPEFFKYTDENAVVIVDDATKMQPFADALFKRFSELPDLSGSVRIHVKGVKSDLRIGSRLTNSEFENARIHRINIDYVERSRILEVSTLPIRETFALLKLQRAQKTLPRGGWLRNKSNDNQTNCFCGGPIWTDDGGGGVGGLLGNLGRNVDGESWECIQCHCQRLNNANGQFATELDCERVCNDDGPAGYTFVDCAGCVCAEQGGDFATRADCEAANPNPINDTDCDFICDDDNGCQAVGTGQGQYGTLAACQAACEGGGETGSGDPGNLHSLGSGAPPTAPTTDTVTPQAPAGTGPCAESVAPQTFTIVAPSFAGASSETPVVTLIKDIITDSCGRVVSVVEHPPFSVVPKWQ
ncbi:hypothetical protein LCGC14_0401680 [marine sediment metagenome]|uniref:Uncharacterized protein n=1 Tax=marine sediment metagenome TaxID=412755 RepID=A0A0F9SWT5_9ZZZZ